MASSQVSLCFLKIMKEYIGTQFFREIRITMLQGVDLDDSRKPLLSLTFVLSTRVEIQH